jgi:Protein of unknown function (DUF3800)
VYRLYIDESGDHTSCDPTDVAKRYLGLTGVIVEHGNLRELRHSLEVFKRRHLPYDDDDPPILHREAIRQGRGPFRVLVDGDRRARFDAGLLEWIESVPFRLVGVVIDKVEHGHKKYRQLQHPYHYCLQALLERYCGWLRRIGHEGDVIAEARGGREDMALKEAYERIYKSGATYPSLLTRDLAQKTLTSKHIKLKPKALNVAGLQLADVLAHPVTRDVLRAYGRISDPTAQFPERVMRVAVQKYNHHLFNRRIDGYGRVILA